MPIATSPPRRGQTTKRVIVTADDIEKRLQRTSLAYNDFLFGLSTTGGMDEEVVLRMAAALPPGGSELYFHTGTRFRGGDRRNHARLPTPTRARGIDKPTGRGRAHRARHYPDRFS